jgi:hypothetical protein
MNARIESGKKGEEIVTNRLIKEGWSVENSNVVIQRNCPNYDLIAKKDGSRVLIQVKAKYHEKKASLCGEWKPGEPTFNKKAEFEKADFLVMVRFFEEESECFVLSIEQAEMEANWFGEELIKGRKKNFKQLQPYVSRKKRISTYAFNTREHWERYSEAWHIMSEENAPEKDDTMPSAGKQLMVMGIIVIGITVVLGAGVWLSMYLQ